VVKDGKGKTYGEGSIKETYNLFENIITLRDSLHECEKLLKKR
jgi:hypothetical protein